MKRLLNRRHIFPIMLSMILGRRVVHAQTNQRILCQNGSEGIVELVDANFKDSKASLDLEARISILCPVSPWSAKSIEIARSFKKITYIEPGGVTIRYVYDINHKAQEKSINAVAWLNDGAKEARALWNERRIFFYLMTADGSSSREGQVNSLGFIDFGDARKILYEEKSDLVVVLDGVSKKFRIDTSTHSEQYDKAKAALVDLLTKFHMKQCYAGETLEKKGCVMTTSACCILGLPDNCFELRMMRKLRDTWLKNQPFGKDVVEWYYANSNLFLAKNNLGQHNRKILLYYIFFVIPSTLLIASKMNNIAYLYLKFGFKISICQEIKNNVAYDKKTRSWLVIG